MKPLDRTKLSRSISYALRHAPQEFGLILDKGGWVEVEALLRSLRSRHRDWKSLELQDLKELLARAKKKRFEIRGGRIRAMYGHSVSEKIEFLPGKPPEALFHGTTPEAAEAILREGLRPMGRQYVHLSVDRETALRVAARRTRTPVLFLVRAEKAHADGLAFYPGQDQTWLCDGLDTRFLEVQKSSDTGDLEET